MRRYHSKAVSRDLGMRFYHFVERLAKLYDADNSDWAPSLKLDYKSCHSASHSMIKYERIARRNSKKRSRADDGADN